MCEKRPFPIDPSSKQLVPQPRGVQPRQHYFEIAASEIDPDPENVRKEFTESSIAELAVTLRRDGILQPLLVRPQPGKPERYFVIAGERRLRAAKLAGLPSVPVIVRQADKIRGIQMIENLHRSDLTPLEKADGIAAVMKEEGLDAKATAQRLGFASDREIRRHLQLHHAPAFLRTALREGVRVESDKDGSTRITTRAVDYRIGLEILRAYNQFAKRDFSQEKSVACAQAEKLMKRALAEGWTLQDFERFAASWNQARRTGGKKQSSKALFSETARSFRIDLARIGEKRGGGGESLDSLIQRLETLLAQVRETRASHDAMNPVPEAE